MRGTIEVSSKGVWSRAAWAAVLLIGSAMATAQTLPNGGVVSGSIGAVGEVHTYTFIGAAGQGVQLRIADTGNVPGFRPVAAVTAEDGSSLGQTGGASPDERVSALGTGVFGLTSTGTYTVRVSAHNMTATGDYDLYFVRAPGAAEGGALPNGLPTTGTIDLGDIDSFTFTANAGDGLEIRVADAGNVNGFRPVAVLYGPNGEYVGTTSGASSNELVNDFWTNVGLSYSGTYTLVVMDSASNRVPTGTGLYRLHTARLPGASDDGSLYDGVARTGLIDLGDIDSFQFTVTAGQTFRLDVTETSTSADFEPQLRLYGPTGAYLATARGETVATTTRANAPAGTYWVLVADSDNDPTGVGTYEIVLTGAGGAPPVDVPLPLWSLLALGGLLGARMWRLRAVPADRIA